MLCWVDGHLRQWLPGGSGGTWTVFEDAACCARLELAAYAMRAAQILLNVDIGYAVATSAGRRVGTRQTIACALSCALSARDSVVSGKGASACAWTCHRGHGTPRSALPSRHDSTLRLGGEREQTSSPETSSGAGNTCTRRALQVPVSFWQKVSTHLVGCNHSLRLGSHGLPS